MGATLRVQNAGRGGALARKIIKIKRACAKSHVVAGYISGVSSLASIEKANKSEFGGRGRPARPFMQQSVSIIAAEIKEIAPLFETDDADTFLVMAGSTMATGVRASIDTQNFHPLSKRRLLEKNGRGRILVDTQEMYDNAKSEIREGAL